MTNSQQKDYVIDFKEFINSDCEVSNYETPIAAIVPPPGDKVWHYVKKAISDGPYWGFNIKSQEEINKEKGIRDGKTKDKPHDSGKNSKS